MLVECMAVAVVGRGDGGNQKTQQQTDGRAHRELVIVGNGKMKENRNWQKSHDKKGISSWHDRMRTMI